ncbi:MAG: glucose-6-phosphate isomerase, partial [Bacteroidales bacterium]|nr:glucose-6-phosphate isomerase [Bacteroidales bacterium]
MANLEIDISKTFNFINKNEVFGLQDEVSSVHKALIEGTGKGNDYLGWMKLPSQTDERLISRIEEEALRIKDVADILIVIGIGGSYLGARAVIEALNHHLDSLLQNRKAPLILYAGHHFGEDYLVDLLDILDDREYALVVISKSGTTTEPAIAFRILKNHLEHKYGKPNARKRIIAITDKSRGALKQLSNEEGYATFTVPYDVGGRYSVLTPVGLLPVAVAGFNIRELLSGARNMEQLTASSNRLEKNPAALYAATRNALYRKGKTVEVLAGYLPSLNYLTEWWKQLYGESEGKENKGIFPAGVNLTTDLHSMGQYIQEGERIIFETVLSVNKTKHHL